MNPDRGAAAGRLLLAVIVLGYPLLVYFLLDELGPAALGLSLIALLVVRARAFINRQPRTIFLIAVVIGAVFLIANFTGDGALVLKFYPTLMSLFLLTAFAYTLWNPPSMIERIARSTGDVLSERAESYTRVVTMLWCCFFATNALIAALISISGSMKTWAIYNGFVSYAIMALLLIGEIVFRYFYKRYHGLTGGLQ
jgi:uncharacterized membrane protein